MRWSTEPHDKIEKRILKGKNNTIPNRDIANCLIRVQNMGAKKKCQEALLRWKRKSLQQLHGGKQMDDGCRIRRNSKIYNLHKNPNIPP